jgi:hypothetical protein
MTGVALNEQNALNSVEAYNPATNTWSTGPALPVYARGAGVTADSQGRVFVIGGQDLRQGAGVADRLLTSVEIFDPAFGGWTTADSLTSPVFTLTAWRPS